MKKKYETEELTDEEKGNIFEFIKEYFGLQNQDDLKQIYGNLQLIIFYLINNIDDIEKPIKEIIENSNKYTKINDENFIGIFEANGMKLKGKKLISIFTFVEHLCFDLFSRNLIDEYNAEIDENIKNKIKDNLTKNKYIKKIAASVRRFISRFLYKIRNKEELSPEGKLIIQLRRKDLWNKDLRSGEKIEKMLEPIEEYNLKVGQSFHFYQLIKEEDEKEINAYSDEKGKEMEHLEDKKPQKDKKNNKKPRKMKQ